MRIWADADGALWAQTDTDTLCCLYDPETPDDYTLGEPMPVEAVTDAHGPLVPLN